MTKHTSGPWLNYSHAPYSVWKGETQIAICRWRERVFGREDMAGEMKYSSVCADHDTAESNARLIAAAPEMLEACIAVITAFGDRQPLSMDSEGREAVRLCRIAHAKASP
jgi:hypothetical protein